MEYQNKYNLPPELVTLVDRELESGEHVEWAAQPIPGRLARSAIPTVLFGIPWTAFAIFWTAMAAAGLWRKKSEGEFGWFRLFPLWGVPFILIGFGMLSSPFWARRQAKRTAYVLTDRRAIIISVGWRSKVSLRSFDPPALMDLRRTERADGSGDLVFTSDQHTGNRGRDYSTAVGFTAIKDVKEVEERVRRLVRQSRDAQAS
ncbi:MAG: hypothetical protein ABSD29_19190 [Verrucomicrobiota bacterium]|jgi:hypothetical protein